MYDFNITPNRKNTDCTKWDALMRDFGDTTLLPFSIADTDFAALPEVVEALQARVRHGVYGYTFAGEGYLNSVIDWCRRRHDMRVKRENIANFPCVLTALSCVIEALTEPRDGVLINPPVYYPFFDLIKSNGRTLCQSPLREGAEGYALDFEEIEHIISTQNVKLYLLCSPHNPVGRVWKSWELERLVEICLRHNVLLFSDEIHSDLVYSPNKHTSILNVPGAQSIALMAYAPSKTFNLAGLKSSTVLSLNPEIMEKVNGAVSKHHLSINLMAYTATQAAYTYGHKWVDELIEYLEKNARFVAETISNGPSRIKAYVPEGTFLMWLDFRAYGLSQRELMGRIQGIAGLALDDGSIFGQGGAGFARLNIGTSIGLVETAVGRLTTAFK